MAHELYHDTARWRLDEQLTQIAALNNRLSIVFTTSTALLALFLTFQDVERIVDQPVSLTLLLVGAVVYATLVVAALIGYLERRLALGPELGQLRAASSLAAFAFIGDESDRLRLWAADEMLAAVNQNEWIIRRKRRYTVVTLWLWAIAASLLAAAVLSATL